MLSSFTRLCTMQRRKSQRHVHAANARWRAAEARAEAEREAGIHDREPFADVRQPFELDLRTYGGRMLRVEPRLGYIACRAVDAETGEVVAYASPKELLHKIADSLPRMFSARRDGQC